MKIPGFSDNKEENAVFWKGVRKNVWKGIKLGVVSGLMIWGISAGLATVGVPYVSQFDVFNLFAESGAMKGVGQIAINALGFVGVNSLWWAATNSVAGGTQELSEHKAAKKEKELHGKVKELSLAQGKDDHFRKRTEALLDAVEQEATVTGTHSSRAVQEILSKGTSSRGSFADKVIADRQMAQAQEAAV